jgi:hypothetical protein
MAGAVDARPQLRVFRHVDVRGRRDVLAASILALHSRLFPNRLAVFGFPAALAGLLGALVWPSALVLAWILAVSVVLLLQQRPAPTAAPPSP